MSSATSDTDISVGLLFGTGNNVAQSGTLSAKGRVAGVVIVRLLKMRDGTALLVDNKLVALRSNLRRNTHILNSLDLVARKRRDNGLRLKMQYKQGKPPASGAPSRSLATWDNCWAVVRGGFARDLLPKDIKMREGSYRAKYEMIQQDEYKMGYIRLPRHGAAPASVPHVHCRTQPLHNLLSPFKEHIHNLHDTSAHSRPVCSSI